MIHTLANVAGPAFPYADAGLYEYQPGDVDALIAAGLLKIEAGNIQITRAGRLELRKPRGKPPRKQIVPEPISADERTEAPSPPTDGDRVEPLGFPDEADPRDEELKDALARAEAAEARVRELEAKVSEPPPMSLPPNPAETRLADYGEVGGGSEADWLGVPAWLAAEERDGEAMPDRIARLTAKFKARVNELTNLLLDKTITEEQDRERTMLLAKYNDLAELGDRS